ncbi:MAG TPA: amino acid ABC transporter substrate-binding protein [Anaerolineae bacterium]|nr:amino acid ABC transporter substrate-binding protein [Anaerolineae bacterium]
MKNRLLMLGIALLVFAIVAWAAVATTIAAPPAAPAAQATATIQPTLVISPTVQTSPTTAATAAATTAPSGAATAPAPTSVAAVATGRLKTVLDRGHLICGINGQLAGFSVLESDGSYSGLDAEYCRAVAAALFNDVSKVEYRPLTTQNRFAALQSGEVDVLMRNTTFTTNRDTAVGLDFLPTTFFDGGGILVPKSANVTKLEDLAGATICVLSGTTNEQVLTDTFNSLNIQFTPLTFPEANALYAALNDGRCDAATSDKSQLAGQRASLLTKPDDWVIMDVTLSKEPLSPAVLQNDAQWADVIRWVVYATWYAEELGVNKANVDDKLANGDTNTKRFLGATGSLGKDMGLSNDAFYRVIKLVGNYSDIFEKTLGPNTKFNVPRGLNIPYTQGGLQYSPPFR